MKCHSSCIHLSCYLTSTVLKVHVLLQLRTNNVKDLLLCSQAREVALIRDHSRCHKSCDIRPSACCDQKWYQHIINYDTQWDETGEFWWLRKRAATFHSLESTDGQITSYWSSAVPGMTKMQKKGDEGRRGGGEEGQQWRASRGGAE